MWLALLLAASQPLPTTCNQVVEELKMRPPAYGEKERIGYVWQKWVQECEAKTGGPGAVLSVEDMGEITKALQGQ
jgi:hypothetical protein